jgi:small multidrug resistance family-3 protein
MAFVLKTLCLFIVTAIAEIVGCYLPYLWLKDGASRWVLLPAALSLSAFAWLLSLHPGTAGRTYAAYGGVYVAVALLWLWLIDGQRPDRWDVVGVAVTVIGMSIIAFAPRVK